MTEQSLAEEILYRAAAVKLLLMDCDGVLTDGRLYFSAAGEEMKVFNVRDGQGIVHWHQAGFKSGIITGREGEAILKKRADELGMDYLHVRSEDKANDLKSILIDAGIAAEETAFIGDDVGDLPVLQRVGFPIAVADAVPEVLAVAAFVTNAAGGHGAVREAIEVLLRAKRQS